MYEAIIQAISDIFTEVNNVLPEKYRALLGILIYTIFIVLYAVFIWKFYKFLARRNIIELNLKQYNQTKYPKLGKFFEILLTGVEYVIILPFLVLFWFVVFAIFLLVLSKSQSTAQILLVTAAIIAATRITSYISEDLSKDISKIFPFTVLALFLLDPNYFNLEELFNKIQQIPNLFENILIFIVFIFVIEFILRGFNVVVSLIYSKDEELESSEK